MCCICIADNCMQTVLELFILIAQPSNQKQIILFFNDIYFRVCLSPVIAISSLICLHRLKILLDYSLLKICNMTWHALWISIIHFMISGYHVISMAVCYLDIFVTDVRLLQSRSHHFIRLCVISHQLIWWGRESHFVCIVVGMVLLRLMRVHSLYTFCFSAVFWWW